LQGQRVVAARGACRPWYKSRLSVVTREGRIIWVADAHRGDGKRFVVRADEKLTAFVELENSLPVLN
jgi:hypothetical protein